MLKALLILGLLSSLGILPGQASAQCVAPPADLVSWWPGDGDATDIVGGLDGTPSGTAFTPGMVGQAFSFDGIDDVVSVGDVLDSVFVGPDKRFTIDAWVKPETQQGIGTTAIGTILGKHADSNFSEDQRGFALSLLTGNRLRFTWANLIGTSFRGVSTITPLDDPTRWYHVAVTYDATIDSNDGLDRVKLYIDSVEEPQFLASVVGPLVDIQDGTAQLGIGALVNTPGTASISNFNGLIDEVEVFDRILSAAEIQSIHLAGSAGKCKLPADPFDLIIALIAEVLGLNLQQGIENGLDSKLNAALRVLDDFSANNDGAAINTLDAFVSEVQAQRGSKIPAADADALIADALEIIALLSGS